MTKNVPSILLWLLALYWFDGLLLLFMIDHTTLIPATTKPCYEHCALQQDEINCFSFRLWMFMDVSLVSRSYPCWWVPWNCSGRDQDLSIIQSIPCQILWSSYNSKTEIRLLKSRANFSRYAESQSLSIIAINRACFILKTQIDT